MTNANPSTSSSPFDIFREHFLIEFAVAERQLLAIANAIPADQYKWRPNETTRSVSEVFVHVAAGPLSLLAVIGQLPPREIYGEISGGDEAALWQVVRRNDELEKTMTQK